MPIALYRIDDRLIHGQVVVGWGQPLGLRFIVLVDDDVAASEWEQDLYRMGVPPDMRVHFHAVADMPAVLAGYQQDPQPGLLLVSSINTMARLVEDTGNIPTVNVGGVHHAAGRTARMRYVFLTAHEEGQLRAMADAGVAVTAQDVPSTRPVPLAELLAQRADV